MSTPEWMTDEVVDQAGDIICDVLDSHGHNGFECRPDAGFDLHCAEAFRAALTAVLPDMLRQAKAENEPLPVVSHKGPHDTDVSIFRTMAEKLRRDEPVGGSNASDALARLIDREVARANRIEQGGQP